MLLLFTIVFRDALCPVHRLPGSQVTVARVVGAGASRRRSSLRVSQHAVDSQLMGDKIVLCFVWLQSRHVFVTEIRIEIRTEIRTRTVRVRNRTVQL